MIEHVYFPKVFHEMQPDIGYSIAAKQESTNVDPSSSLLNRLARLQHDGRTSFLSAGGENWVMFLSAFFVLHPPPQSFSGKRKSLAT
jgi:hypothetical protein